MEKDRGTKTMAIVALMVAVVSLSVGFAAFSSALNVSSSATVSPVATTFNVDFSSSSSGVETNSITPTVTGDATATNATISNTGDPTITGLAATFTAPGQSATYTFYAYNAGEYLAYLNSITFANASGGSSFRVCTAGDGATDTLVQAACDDISVSIKVGSESATTGSVASIAGHSLAVGAGEEIVVTISYASDGDRADGDFTVAFGDITLKYDSVD